MGVVVKICGINSSEAANAALRAGADFAGLVFFERSPRHLSLPQAATLARMLRGRAKVVALLVDPPDAIVDQVMAVVSPDFIQLHGSEPPARVAAIAARAARPIIRALAVADSEDIVRAHAYEEMADYLLFDAKVDASATRPGGWGAAFDWQLVAGRTFRRPFGLAGGLTPENVGRAIQVSGAQLVDASSGVEDAPGRKSPEKIAAFVAAARNAPYTNIAGAA
jgi:phosphoribosylanthranilate isomerase